MSISLYWGIWIFATHLAIDNRKFVIWWNKIIKQTKNTPFWLTIMQDQILHLLALIPILI